MLKQKKSFKYALTIAGFDGSGGAGIQADLKTFSALNCYGLSVLTALPVQNTQGVQSVYDIPAYCIREQLECIHDDISTNVIKIGMLNNSEIIHEVAKFLLANKTIPVVLDPVMFAKSGHPLLKMSALETLTKNIIPLATIITPNIPEASHLAQQPIHSIQDMESACRKIAQQGIQTVIVKGGHSRSETCADCVFHDNQIHWLNYPRIRTQNTHGTGCTFSAAITAFLANGEDTLSSIKRAKDYTHNAIVHAADYKIGKGCGPLHHFYNFTKTTSAC